MRHDPASAALVVMLRGLKMYGMAQAVAELVAAVLEHPATAVAWFVRELAARGRTLPAGSLADGAKFRYVPAEATAAPYWLGVPSLATRILLPSGVKVSMSGRAPTV